MFLTDMSRRDWLLLAALTCIGPFWYGFVRVYAAIAGTYILEWSGVRAGLPAYALLTAVGAVGSVVAAVVLIQSVIRYVQSPLPVFAGVALLVPLVIAVGLWIEFSISAGYMLELLGFELLAFSLTFVALGYRASRLHLKAE